MTGAGAGGFVIACVAIKIIDTLQMPWCEIGLKNIRTIQFIDGAKG